MMPKTRRAKWLGVRARRGRVRPAPVVVRVPNAASVTFGEDRVAAIWDTALTKPGKWGAPTLVLATEMADIDARADGWQVAQGGYTGSPESALAAAADKSRAKLHDVRLVAGTPATSEGGGIRQRPIQVGMAIFDEDTPGRWSVSWANGHAPPGRAPRARSEYLGEFGWVRAQIKVGDLNILHVWAARILGARRVHSAGVLHAAVPRWIPSRSAVVDVDGDHLALDVVLWPTLRWRHTL